MDNDEVTIKAMDSIVQQLRTEWYIWESQYPKPTNIGIIKNLCKQFINIAEKTTNETD